MQPDYNGPEEIAIALDYLGGAIGTETALDLRGVSRALANMTWFPPEPPSLETHDCACRYKSCIFAEAIVRAETSLGRPLNHARKLLEPGPAENRSRKICLIHQDADLSPGFDLVAVQMDDGALAYRPNDAITPEEARKLVNGASCLFTRG